MPPTLMTIEESQSDEDKDDEDEDEDEGDPLPSKGSKRLSHACKKTVNYQERDMNDGDVSSNSKTLPEDATAPLHDKQATHQGELQQNSTSRHSTTHTTGYVKHNGPPLPQISSGWQEHPTAPFCPPHLVVSVATPLLDTAITLQDLSPCLLLVKHAIIHTSTNPAIAISLSTCLLSPMFVMMW
ncbi:hypothetical protein BS17DRAFT_816809 [Gyrodon lividus]|nr:hypothetical protein BS17DRAFT_816809 [Gyrodon lividus]